VSCIWHPPPGHADVAVLEPVVYFLRRTFPAISLRQVVPIHGLPGSAAPSVALRLLPLYRWSTSNDATISSGSVGFHSILWSPFVLVLAARSHERLFSTGGFPTFSCLKPLPHASCAPLIVHPALGPKSPMRCTGTYATSAQKLS
jgi:hypothetical protein